jgi:predicted SnoaL-like aldol condensation-catalyzing enzyme
MLGMCVAVCVAVSAAAIAEEHMNANERLCNTFRQDVIMGGQIDAAPMYAASDFKEHNLRLQADGLQAFMTKYKQMRSGSAPPARASAAPPMPRPQWMLSGGDIVVFITPLPAHPDAGHPGETVPASTHYDVWRIRNGKLAEHWD